MSGWESLAWHCESCRFATVTQFRLYIDDSGTKEYASDPSAYSRTGNTRYFAFGGVLLDRIAASKLGSSIANEKRATFGTDAVEVKSNWLRMPNERRKHYLEPYRLTELELTAFVERYYGLIADSELQLVAAVIDKVHMQEDYPSSPWYAPTVAYELLLQRVVHDVHLPATVAVTIDDIPGATPKGNPYTDNLKAQHRHLRTRGSRLQRGLNFGCLEPDLRFVNSAFSHLVQVADVVVYNVYRQFYDHGDAWEDAAAKTLPAYAWFKRLGRKFRSDGTGRIQGYGVVKFPLRKQVRWGLYE